MTWVELRLLVLVMLITLYHCNIVSLYHCIIVSLYHCITVSLYHCIIVSLHHCIIVSLYHCIIVSLYHCFIVSTLIFSVSFCDEQRFGIIFVVSLYHFFNFIVSLYHCFIVSILIFPVSFLPWTEIWDHLRCIFLLLRSSTFRALFFRQLNSLLKT